jgi:hypothetical protein
MIPTDTVYPALIDRARKIATEYATLSKQLEGGFDPTIAKKAGELSLITDALKLWDNANKVGHLHVN